ncbi:MAG: type II toxin-antitoxin system death-on-curing family toxin [Candidatus Krumholzibacteria bacterium]|nr:type II toxin-antitoxin system death-on-curing family toxin [Candidatus Krumholzibacteria bacterium]
MQPVVFLSVDDVLMIHNRVIEEFGGDSGLRDRGLLESAVAMPQSTFGGSDLHPGLADKAAAYHFHLCANHAFVDGNKRVAVAAAEVFLLINGHELSASDDEIEELTQGVAGGQLSKDQVMEFFEKFIMESHPA